MKMISFMPKFSLRICLTISIVISGCDSDNNSEALAKAVKLESQRAKGTIIEKVTIIGAMTRLRVGEVHQLTALGIDSNDDERDVTTELAWSSSDTSIATVNSKGLVEAVANSTEPQGKVVITGTTINGILAQGEMSVSDSAISSLTLKQSNPISGDINTCIDANIVADVTYEDDYTSLNVTKYINFSVDENTTATIEDGGILHTSNSEIENTIVSGKVNNISNQLTVTADPKNLETIDVLVDDKVVNIITLNVGDRIILQSQVNLVSTISETPINIDNNISLEAKNSELAGITLNGTTKGSILALKPGVTQVYATCGGVQGNATLEIKGDATLDTLLINQGEETITIKANESVEISVTAQFEETIADINVTEFSEFTYSKNDLISSELVSAGTSAANYKIISTSNTTGEVFLTVTYDGESSLVKLIIE
ncbi:hypothetical protein CJF42_04070 [Pseudoalteromonas sp. NBT06-2]|uniref:Ig-like domain-containing protein n=1 Tax=Pseudoalteromonas sp. NBT06-2 TaxID=2025950 RepID=UPI000BA7181A|nr:Ig-like domain-containing protein [Pseudoalteromonas sp. NBT06-2]PAJ75673.1 hypothetical protein CJF42_04070 [Pseudoalteromonas sp. NBT06-2]